MVSMLSVQTIKFIQIQPNIRFKYKRNLINKVLYTYLYLLCLKAATVLIPEYLNEQTA